MKKLLLGLGLALVASASLMSCSKGEYNSGDKQTGYNKWADKNRSSFTAKINGSDFVAVYSYAYYPIIITKYLGLSGFGTSESDPHGFAILLKKNEKGVHIISSTTDNGIAYTSKEGVTVKADSGSVIITDLSDTRVKGTFKMTASEGSLIVTDGLFDLPIVEFK